MTARYFPNTQGFKHSRSPADRRTRILSGTMSPRRCLASCLWSLSLALSAGELQLSSPLDHQVFQRQAVDRGTVILSGTDGIGTDDTLHLETRFIAEGRPSPWQRIDTPTVKGRFRCSVEMAAGGWFQLEVRRIAFDRGGRERHIVAEARVEHVGVGEVFVVAGQSNAANHGEERQTPKSGMVATFDGTRWRPAEDPQPGASGGGGSFLPPFGDALSRRLGVPIGLVACGIGATSVREWLPKGSRFPNPPTLTHRVRRLESGEWESDGAAFETLIGRMAPLGPGGFRAVLWHQGESDANQADASRTLPGPLYRESLTRVITESRRRIGWEPPWFVAQVSYHVPGDEASPDIRAAQAALWRDGIALQGPDSDALKGALRDSGGKGVHFSGPGLREHGKRWADTVGAWMQSPAAHRGRNGQ
jgi:hypothetical protein